MIFVSTKNLTERVNFDTGISFFFLFPPVFRVNKIPIIPCSTVVDFGNWNETSRKQGMKILDVR